MRIRALVAGAPLLLSAAGAGAQAQPTLDEVLARMRAYIEDYAQQLPATIAVESYDQRVGAATRYQLRRLKSEYGIIRLSGDLEWLGFREVQSVDGKPVSDSAARLEALLSKPSVEALEQARLLAIESARYNIGPIYRTVNDPAFLLELLDGRNAKRMKWIKDNEATLSGTRVWVVRLDETARPTIIRGRGGDDQPVKGRAWIDPLTGRLLRAEAVVLAGFAAGNFVATIEVQFQHDAAMGFWVPAKMLEKYQNARNLVTVASGEAVYTNYRRFSVDTSEDLLPAR